MLDISYGQKLIGIDSPVLKLKPNSGKFRRMITTSNHKWSDTTPTEDSPLLVISGITLDGNQLEQGPYTGYEKEQQSAIFLHGSTTGDQGQQRLRAVVENCVIKNTCGDGVSVWYGVDVTVTNTFFWNCFRGSVVVIGGNSVVRASGLSAGGDRHTSFFQAEVENDGRVDITLTNSYFNHIQNQPTLGNGLDIGVGPNSNVVVSNCQFEAGLTNLYGRDASTRFHFSNCTFRAKHNDTCVRYGQVIFSGCTFVLLAGNTVALNTRSFGEENLSATFDGCTFEHEQDPIAAATPIGSVTSAVVSANSLTIGLDVAHDLTSPGNYGFDLVCVSGFSPQEYNGAYWVSSVPDATHLVLQAQKTWGAVTLSAATATLVPATHAIGISGGESSTNTITARNCHFGYGFKYAVKQPQGGTVQFHNNQVDSFVMAEVKSSSGFVAVGRYSGNSFLDNCRMHLSIQASGGTSLAEIVVDERVPVKSSFVRRYVGLDGLTIVGKRVIYDATDPAPGQYKLPVDVYENSAAQYGRPRQWVNSLGTYNASDSWRQVQQTVASGNTAARPILSTQDIGAVYIDTDINPAGKTIRWSGSNWIDL